MTRRTFVVTLLIAVFSVVLVLILHSPLSSLEEQMTSLKYQLRGARQADTNIVIVYIDDDAMKDLGWPVRRSFYALMVNALTDLQVKAIGIDVLFEEPNPYPEYDDLLAATMASSRRVVLASYFRSLSAVAPWKVHRPEVESFPGVKEVPLFGEEYHQPTQKLSSAAAGIGHVNIGDENEIPLFVQSSGGIIPSFGMEVLRVFEAQDKAGVDFHSSAASVGSGSKIHTSTQGTVRLNFPGGINAFRTYPFIEVLKSFDAVRMDRVPSIPVGTFKGKIVLISIVALGRQVEGDTYVSTPVGVRYPAIGLHATFLENALNSRFLIVAGEVPVYLLSLILGLCCAVVVLVLKSPLDKLTAFGMPLVVCVGSFALFSLNGYLVPVISPVLVCLLSIFSAFYYRQRLAGAEVDRLQAEKGTIIIQLKDKEAKVARLENELLQLEASRSADRTTELLEEIRRYKQEIHKLSSLADDMEEFEVDREVLASTGEFDGIVYDRSGQMKPVIDFITKIANSDAPVLILGESGTGKELVAKAIHKRSGRAGSPFIAVNCGALAENLVESELFGHEKGAFTGAVKDKPGRFELANGGTIFLDEIGEVSEAFQIKLLRVLQEGELERVGGTGTIRVNVRVLAATNKDLKAQVKARRFREDLFYRLNVLTVSLPSLRERQEDIPLLIRHFLIREDAGMRMSKNVMEVLRAYSWQGNVRELESVIKRAVLLAKADQRTMISLKDLAEEVAASSTSGGAIEDQVLESLREKGFSRSSISETAEELGGLNRGTVAEYLRGQCFKAFVEQGFNIEHAVQHVSLSTDEEVNERVKKKMYEYLANLSDVVNNSVPWEENIPALKPKTKNLPQRYHGYVEQIAETHYRGLWKLPG